GHALVAVLVLAGHAELAPAGAGGQHHAPAAHARAALELDRGHAFGVLRQRGGALQVHDVDVVLAHVRLQLRGQARASVSCTEMKFSIAIVSSTWPPKRSATTPVRMPLRAA